MFVSQVVRLGTSVINRSAINAIQRAKAAQEPQIHVHPVLLVYYIRKSLPLAPKRALSEHIDLIVQKRASVVMETVILVLKIQECAHLA